MSQSVRTHLATKGLRHLVTPFKGGSFKKKKKKREVPRVVQRSGQRESTVTKREVVVTGEKYHSRISRKGKKTEKGGGSIKKGHFKENAGQFRTGSC